MSTTPRSRTDLSLTIIAVILSVAALWCAQEFFVPLVFAALASCALEPIHRRLVRWHVPPWLSAAVLVATVAGGAAGSAWALSTPASKFVGQLPAITKKLRDELHRGGSALGRMLPMQQAANDLKKAADETAPPLARDVQRVQVEEPPMRVTDWLVRGTMGLVGAVAQGTMVLFLTYYLLASGEGYKTKLVTLAGPSGMREHVTLEVVGKIARDVERFLIARVIISVIVGVGTGIAAAAFGVSQPVMWGIAAGVLNNIPYLGPASVVVAITLAALVQFSSAQLAVVVGATAGAVAFVEGFVVTPWLMGRAGRMDTGMVFLGLMFWGWIWGIWGLLLAVPLMMAFKVVGDHVESLRSVSDVLSE